MLKDDMSLNEDQSVAKDCEDWRKGHALADGDGREGGSIVPSMEAQEANSHKVANRERERDREREREEERERERERERDYTQQLHGNDIT